MPFQIIRNDITKAEGADKMFLFTNINNMLETLFVYCLRGSRSRRAVGILKRMGYSAKSIGGITAYKGEIER